MAVDLTFAFGGLAEALKDRPRNHFVLERDRWDDFGHSLQFTLTYFDEGGQAQTIGALKIMRIGRVENGRLGAELRTPLDPTFSELSSDYVSLGQNESYYQDVGRLGPEVAEALLEALRDIAWKPALAGDFEPLSAFRNGLARSNAAQRARRLGRQLVTTGEAYEQPDFTYLHDVGGEEPVRIVFPFDPSDQLPGRIVGLVGRNAVGKTTLMARLASDLAQTGRISADALQKRDARFERGFPLFTRVVAVSYSAFDRFKRPDAKFIGSYVYCGIRDENGRLTQKGLRDTFERNKGRIVHHEREELWIEAILGVLGEGENTDLAIRLAREVGRTRPRGPSFFETLSSGQAMLCHLVTGLLAWLQPNSLVLFDEPETHLHPNAVANLFQVLTWILQRMDSVAVLATHSPVVIQEIPAKRVVWLRRDADGISAEGLDMEFESFGESLSELTRHIFETGDVDQLYKTVLARLARDETIEQVLARFKSGLSTNAQAFLLGQYPQGVR